MATLLTLAALLGGCLATDPGTPRDTDGAVAPGPEGQVNITLLFPRNVLEDTFALTYVAIAPDGTEARGTDYHNATTNCMPPSCIGAEDGASGDIRPANPDQRITYTYLEVPRAQYTGNWTFEFIVDKLDRPRSSAPACTSVIFQEPDTHPAESNSTVITANRSCIEPGLYVVSFDGMHGKLLARITPE